MDFTIIWPDSEQGGLEGFALPTSSSDADAQTMIDYVHGLHERYFFGDAGPT